MPRWMVLCPRCNRFSTRLYRCEHPGCRHDLVDAPTPIVPFEYRTVAGRRDDGLVEVEFRRICVACGAVHYAPIDYEDIGLVIRYPCEACGEPTKHRPVDEDLRYRVKQLGFTEDDDGDDQEESRDDQDPLISTPA